MKALVIGSTGLIGSHVARALLEGGHDVRAMRRSRSRTAALEGIEAAIEPAVGDIRDRASIAAAARGCAWVFHAAGHYPTVSLDLGRILETAVTGMRYVLDASLEAGAEVLVYTSSLSTIGRPGGGRALRDVGVGHLRAAERGRPGERYILGNENTTMAAFCERMACLAGVAPPRFRVPAGLAHAAALSSEVLAKYVTGRPPLLPLEGVNMIRHGQHYDVTRARTELGLPESPLDRAILDALEWFGGRGEICAQDRRLAFESRRRLQPAQDND